MSWQRLVSGAQSLPTSSRRGMLMSLIAVSSAVVRSLALDLLRAAARGGAASAVLKRCLAQAPPEQAMYLVLLHHHREHGNLQVSLSLQ